MTTCGYVLTFQISPPTERRRIRLIEGLHTQRGRSREISASTWGGPKPTQWVGGWNRATWPRVKILRPNRENCFVAHVSWLTVPTSQLFLLIKKSFGSRRRHNATLYRVVIIWKKLKMEKDSGPTLAEKFRRGFYRKLLKKHVRSV